MSVDNIQEVSEEAQSLIEKLLPPVDYGEDQDAERLYNIVGLLGERLIAASLLLKDARDYAESNGHATAVKRINKFLTTDIDDVEE